MSDDEAPRAPEAADTPVGPGGRELGGALARLLARIADGLIVYSLFSLAGLALNATIDIESFDETTQFTIILLVILGVAAIYETVGTAKFAKTGGKYLVGLEVVDRDTGGPPMWGRAFNRAVLLWAPALALPMASLIVWPVVILAFITIDAQRRGLQDRLARTLVVRAPRAGTREAIERRSEPRPEPRPEAITTGEPTKEGPARPKASKGVEERRRRWQQRGKGR